VLTSQQAENDAVFGERFTDTCATSRIYHQSIKVMTAAPDAALEKANRKGSSHEVHAALVTGEPHEESAERKPVDKVEEPHVQE
jgi:hypothetical protein